MIQKRHPPMSGYETAPAWLLLTVHLDGFEWGAEPRAVFNSL